MSQGQVVLCLYCADEETETAISTLILPDER